jgi:hypothetical protein
MSMGKAAISTFRNYLSADVERTGRLIPVERTAMLAEIEPMAEDRLRSGNT